MRGPGTAGYGLRYVGPVRNDASLLVDGEHLRADDYIQHDLTLMYDWDDQKARFTLGIENVADTMPPFLEGNYDNGFANLNFNSRGRFFLVRRSEQRRVRNECVRQCRYRWSPVRSKKKIHKR